MLGGVRGRPVILSDVRSNCDTLSCQIYSSPNSVIVERTESFSVSVVTKSPVTVADVSELIRTQRPVVLSSGVRGFVVFHMGLHVVLAVAAETPLVVAHISMVYV